MSGSVSCILNEKSDDVWSIDPNAMVFDAIKKMTEKNIGALPVLDGDRLLGVVTERDYTRKVMLQGKSSRQTPVREIMSQLVVAAPDDTVTECMELMTEKRVRHLPVVQDGKLLGIVSIGDLVRWTLSAQAATIEHLERYITGEYPT